MNDFEKCNRAYQLGATEEQLQIWVKAGKITQEEYEKIIGVPPIEPTGDVYSSDELEAAYQEGVESIG